MIDQMALMQARAALAAAIAEIDSALSLTHRRTDAEPRVWPIDPQIADANAHPNGGQESMAPGPSAA